jgi:tricorn protease
MTSGYYRYPTLHNDTAVFVCEDDLWTVPAGGGLARRLTANLGEVSFPSLSPDGQWLAFVGREEGAAEVYVMPALGGPARRLTWQGASRLWTAGWTADGRILYASNAGQPFIALLHLHTVGLDGSPPQRLNRGPARAIAFGPGGASVIGRNTADPARWKRYRGGTAGQLWIDREGDGQFRPLLTLQGNLASPMWLGAEADSPGRIYFLSDHEGVGNLYSCLPSGDDLRRHTDHADYYARNAASDGRRIVYHAGADLYLFDPASDSGAQIAVEFHSPQVQRSRKFVEAGRFLNDYDLHPQGHRLAIEARGKTFTFANWEAAVLQHGDDAGARYRLPRWLNDGQRLVAVTDSGGEESFVILHADGLKPPERLPDLDTGRPVDVAVSPRRDQIAFSNHRNELMCLDLASLELRRIDRGRTQPIGGFAWSPDGAWVAYSVSLSHQAAVIKLWQAETGQVFPVTRPVLRDVAPAFDPGGKYLYFISYRDFRPVYDSLHFDLNFPRGTRPFLVTLQKDLPSPFVLEARPFSDKKDDKDGKPADASPAEQGEGAEPAAGGSAVAKEDSKPGAPLRIDTDGIESRVLAFPVEEGRYGRILGLKDGKVAYSRYPVQSGLEEDWMSTEAPARGELLLFKFEDKKEEPLVEGISDFGLSQDASALVYRAGRRLRVLKAGEKPANNGGGADRKGGWIDLGRVKVSVVPGLEWRQMFREAWRLQRDHFWAPDMSQVDWLAVHDRYLLLADRVASRSEFSDLMWEMQGELGTSHAYELGGDYRPAPSYGLGFLGADFSLSDDGAWQIAHIVQGDSWDESSDSPLRAPGANLQPGHRLLAVNGQPLGPTFPPSAALVNLAGQEVTLTVQPEAQAAPRLVTVRALRNEMPARYREWVEAKRQRVHEATGGRVGYVHIPDMGASGYAEFHRSYLAEVDRDGLLIDLRFNSGGHVSGLLLEKLARRRIGYDFARWSDEPMPFPPESALGPMVALTNEHAGSDGDIFSHGFKMLKLGPLMGKRTWGGVIGIWPRHWLADGTITTQPEMSFWFEDVGWGVENYGTDPDIVVEDLPQDHARGVDTQLEAAIAEVLRLLEASPPRRPSFDGRPSRALPKLPPR